MVREGTGDPALQVGFISRTYSTREPGFDFGPRNYLTRWNSLFGPSSSIFQLLYITDLDKATYCETYCDTLVFSGNPHRRVVDKLSTKRANNSL
jgi:hypothetical protein